jgi:hypothetical protein
MVRLYKDSDIKKRQQTSLLHHIIVSLSELDPQIQVPLLTRSMLVAVQFTLTHAN